MTPAVTSAICGWLELHVASAVTFRSDPSVKRAISVACAV
jgi:hypothetical protein